MPDKQLTPKRSEHRKNNSALASANHAVVSHEKWLTARTALLAKEKDFNKLRDDLSRQRRELPWELVDKNYIFEGTNGKQSLAELFAGKSQLIVHHFMLGPGWDAGCPSCSFWADNYNGISIHLKHRDISLLAISRAPLPEIEAYRQRMGWSFKWVSSFATDFNFDFNASFTTGEVANGTAFWNYRKQKPESTEVVGFSAFYKDPDGQIFHTYSCYQRGIDMINGAYHFMDLMPKGRDEADQRPTMAWLRRHDEYED
jgi:predicted dithiol-disulfide oxidoreductase (DUF899 family)